MKKITFSLLVLSVFFLQSVAAQTADEVYFEWVDHYRHLLKEDKKAARTIYEAQLLEAEDTHGEKVYDGNATLCIGLARMGQPTQRIVAGTLHELKNVDMGDPLHSLIICGDLHDLELEIIKEYLIENSTYETETPSESEPKSSSEAEITTKEE